MLMYRNVIQNTRNDISFMFWIWNISLFENKLNNSFIIVECLSLSNVFIFIFDSIVSENLKNSLRSLSHTGSLYNISIKNLITLNSLLSVAAVIDDIDDIDDINILTNISRIIILSL